jgi:hypothetical protein
MDEHRSFVRISRPRAWSVAVGVIATVALFVLVSGASAMPLRPAVRVRSATTARKHARHAPTYPAAVAACLRQGGLGHIRRIRASKWQGTIGQYSDHHVNDSVFVLGPYRTSGTAASSVRLMSRSWLSFHGGRFAVYAVRSFPLPQAESLVAACLSGIGQRGYTF